MNNTRTASREFAALECNSARNGFSRYCGGDVKVSEYFAAPLCDTHELAAARIESDSEGN